MGLNLYSQEKDSEKLSHLKQLLLMAVADGHLHDKELAAIAAVMSRDNLTEEDFAKCIDDPDSIDIVLPKSDNSRVKYLRDMVLLMMADGVIDKSEMETCRLTAEALGFRSDVVDELLQGLIKSIRQEA